MKEEGDNEGSLKKMYLLQFKDSDTKFLNFVPHFN